MAQPQLSADHPLLMPVAAGVVDIQPHRVTQAAAVEPEAAVQEAMEIPAQTFRRELQILAAVAVAQEMARLLHKMDNPAAPAS